MEKIMEVENKRIFIKKIKSNYKRIGFGSEGDVYDLGNKVIKILINDEIEKQYLQFSDIKLKHFYFIKQIYTYKNKPIALVSNKCLGKNMLEINPLIVNINKYISAYINLKAEVITLSEMGIHIYDVLCNCMYNSGNIGIIDTTEFEYTEIDKDKLLKENLYTIQTAHLDFLIAGYFNYYIYSNKKLKELYLEFINKNADIYELFLNSFINNIKEDIGKEINKLNEAKTLIKKTESRYPRFIRNDE